MKGLFKLGELTLFDFDFTDEGETTYEQVEQAFKEVQEISKSRGNPYFMGLTSIEAKTRMLFPEFEKAGWIKLRGSGFEILEDYLVYHTVEELINDYRIKSEALLNKPKVCWYGDFLSLRNHHRPIRFASEDDRELYHDEKSKVTKEYALKLGLDHFMNVPSSRGMKMSGNFSTAWSKENVLPIIAEKVIAITDIEEMDDYFRRHVFFYGRRDFDKKGYNKDYKIPPYPEYRSFSPTEFDLACLCQADDQKTVQLIFDYMGCAYGGIRNKEIIYPPGWSKEVYEDSLTAEDKEVIRLDKERLERLHNGG